MLAAFTLPGRRLSAKPCIYSMESTQPPLLWLLFLSQVPLSVRTDVICGCSLELLVDVVDPAAQRLPPDPADLHLLQLEELLRRLQ